MLAVQRTLTPVSQYNGMHPVVHGYCTKTRGRRLLPRSVVNPFIKYILFFANFIFWMVSGILVGLITWVLVEKKARIRDIFDLLFDPAIFLCITGSLIFILAFFGCVGSLRENLCCLRMFHISLSVLLVLEMLLGILIFVLFYAREVRQRLTWLNPEDSLMNALVKYRDREHADLRDLINGVQRKFECCGVRMGNEGFRDWQQNNYFNCSQENLSPERCGVPYSCCRRRKDQHLLNLQCGFHTTDRPVSTVTSRIYTRGCIQGVGEWLEKNAVIVGGICFGIIVPQAIAICLACILVDQIRLQRARWDRTGLTVEEEEVNPGHEYTETYTLI